nr:RHS repeat domain-containing protein [Collimonas pratensis]
MVARTVLSDQAPLFATGYEYDRAGNQTQRSDSEHGSDLYRYDRLGNLLRHTDPAGKVTEFLNDPAGDRLRMRIRQMEMRRAAKARLARMPSMAKCAPALPRCCTLVVPQFVSFTWRGSQIPPHSVVAGEGVGR